MDKVCIYCPYQGYAFERLFSMRGPVLTGGHYPEIDGPPEATHPAETEAEYFARFRLLTLHQARVVAAVFRLIAFRGWTGLGYGEDPMEVLPAFWGALPRLFDDDEAWEKRDMEA